MTLAPLVRAAFLPLIGGAHGDAGGSYAALGNPTTQTVQSLSISSSFDNSVFLSIDGTDDHIFVDADSTVTLDISGNKQGTGKLGLPLGTQFYMKQGPDGAPTSGDLFITALYGR